MTMRSRIEARIAWLGAARHQAIDAALAELETPTPFMLEAGELAFNQEPRLPVKMRLRWAFQAMISEAEKGG